MAHYVEVDSADFEAWLQSKGFARSVFHNEVVYSKPSQDVPGATVKVYTSSSTDASVARDVGKDAIRIVAIFEKDGKVYPIYKGARVYRTTSQDSVKERTLIRITEAITRITEWKKEQEQKKPYAPQYVGELGQSLRGTLKVVERKPWQDKFLFTLRDKEGRGDVYCFWSERDLLKVGETYILRFKIIRHSIFNGVNQNTIADVFGKRVVA